MMLLSNRSRRRRKKMEVTAATALNTAIAIPAMNAAGMPISGSRNGVCEGMMKVETMLNQMRK